MRLRPVRTPVRGLSALAIAAPTRRGPYKVAWASVSGSRASAMPLHTAWGRAGAISVSARPYMWLDISYIVP